MSKLRLRRALACLGTFVPLLIAGATFAQPGSDTRHDDESRAVQALSRGRIHEATEAVLEAYEKLRAELDVTTESRQLRILAARATALLAQVQLFTDATATWGETLERLDRLEPAPMPLLEARVDWLRLLGARAVGRLDRALQIEKKLGFIPTWAIAGPFDNERGTGFDTAFPPEAGVDLDAVMRGKDRDVRWFPLAATPTTGYIDLDEILTPNDQSAAYAVTHVFAEQDRRLALHIASDESFRIWVDGDEVLARDLRRSATFDQDSCAVRLGAGWNRILVKVCDQTGPWGFRLRITELDGSVAEHLRYAIQPEEALVEHDARLDVEPERGAIFDLRKHLAERPDDLEAWSDLSILSAWIGVDDRSDHADREAAARALALAPERADLRFRHAQMLRRDVEMSAEKEDNPMRRGLESVLEVDPQHVPALEALAAYYQDALGNHFRAREYFERAMAVQPHAWSANHAQWRRWRTQGWQSLYDRALRAFADDTPWHGHPQLERELAGIAAGQQRVRDAVEHLRRAISREARNAEMRAELIALHVRRGELEAARTLLEDRLRLYPFGSGTYRRLAQLWDAEGEIERAIATLDRALEIHPEHPDLLRELGLLHLRAERADAARESLERSLVVQPNQPDVRRYLEHLRSERRPFELEHRSEVETLITEALRNPMTDNQRNESHRTLLDETVVHVNRDGTRQIYRQVVIQVLNQEGIRRQEVQQIPFALGDEVVKVKRARVVHRDGTKDDARIRNFRPGAGGEYRTYRAQNLSLPNLSRGDVIHLEYRIDAIRQSFFGNYFGYRHRFPTDPTAPTDHSRLVLILPSEREFFFNQKNLQTAPSEETTDSGERLLTWDISDLPPLPTETLMPAPRERIPAVEVTTFADWNAFGRWWWNLIEDQHQVSEEMRAKVTELTAGLESREDKVRAIYNFIVSEIRYVAWEFGVHGYKPYRASTIFARRFGDCKDKAILMNTMLGLAGIQAYPVVIRSEDPRSAEDLSLAMVEHFNHCISYVPEGVDGSPLFLDGTAEWHSIDALPSSDRGAQTIVVRGESGEIVPTGYADPSLNRQEETYQLTLRRNGGATVEGEVRARGPRTYPIRKAYASLGDRDQQLEARYGTVFGPSRLLSAEFSEIENLNAPVFYRFLLAVDSLVEPSPDGLRLPSDFFPENLTGLVTDDDRKTDLLLSAPFEEVTTLTYRLPAGFGLRSLPESVDLETPYSFLRLSYESGADDEIVVRKEFGFTRPRVPVEAYPEFRDFCLAAFRALQNEIVIGESR